MIKHFDLNLNYGRGEKMQIDNIAIGDLQNSIIALLDKNTSFSGEIVQAGFNDSFYSGGKN
jgi:hypothetical protein